MKSLSKNSQVNSKTQAFPADGINDEAGAQGEQRGSADDGTRLADTGSFDTTPYVVGGTTLLALGAGFVVYSVRRERLGF